MDSQNTHLKYLPLIITLKFKIHIEDFYYGYLKKDNFKKHILFI